VGGGSNAMGIFSGFVDTDVRLVGVEPAGGSAMRHGVPGVVHGMKSYLMQDEFGQVLEASSIDYYAALRSAYYQNRTALIWRRGPDHGPAARARQVLAALSLGAPGGEVVDLSADRGGEGVEAAALEH
jgi:hypothetical protein